MRCKGEDWVCLEDDCRVKKRRAFKGKITDGIGGSLTSRKKEMTIIGEILYYIWKPIQTILIMNMERVIKKKAK